MIVASTALFIALGGTSYAVTKIDGDQITKRSIDGSKLEINTVTAREIKELGMKTSLAGRADSAVRADSAGNADALGGTAAAAHARNVEIVGAETAISTGNVKDATATCPGTKRVIGGGAQPNPIGEPVAIRRSAPSAEQTGWVARAYETMGASNWQLQVYAVCADR